MSNSGVAALGSRGTAASGNAALNYNHLERNNTELTEDIITESSTDETKKSFVRLQKFTKENGPLAKVISLKDGRLEKDSSQCWMNRGRIQTVQFSTMKEFVEILKLDNNQAIGLSNSNYPEGRQIVTVNEVDQFPGAIARSKNHLKYESGHPAGLMFDRDSSDGELMTVARCDAILINIVPGFAALAKVTTHSSSSFICAPDGTELSGEGNHHTFIIVKDSSDIPRFAKALKGKLQLHGYGRPFVKSDGAFEFRTVFDTTVWASERMIFEANPVLLDGLIQKRSLPEFREGEWLDTTLLPDLTPDEEAEVSRLYTESRTSVSDLITSKKKKYVVEETEKLVKNKGMSQVHAKRVVDRRIDRVLDDDDLLYFDHMNGVAISAGDARKRPDLHKKTLADPSQPDYGGREGTIVPCKAQFYYEKGNCRIHSFAHGSQLYTFYGDRLGSEISVKLTETIRHRLKMSDFIGMAEVSEKLPLDGRVIDAVISGTISKGASQYLQVNPNGCLSQYPEKKILSRLLAMDEGQIITIKEMEHTIERCCPKGVLTSDDIEEIKKFIRNTINSVLITHIDDNNQAKRLDVESDPFIERPSIKITSNAAVISLPHQPYDESLALGISQDIYKKVIEDYKSHFVELDEVLAFLVSSRFAPDRKRSHLWLRAPSDWGKGLLMSQLGELGIVIKLTPGEIEKMFSGQPVSKSAWDFVNGLTLWVDEFKAVRAEMKELQNELTLSPKHQLEQRIPIYSKLFTSAECVGSLIGGDFGVEEQFLNRFCYMDFTNSSQAITERPVYQEHRAVYAQCIKSYMARTINKLIQDFVAKGRYQAAIDADAAQWEFFDRHKLRNVADTLDTGVSELVEEMRSYAQSSCHSSVIFNDGIFYLKRPAAFVQEYLETNIDKTSRGAISYKATTMKELLDVGPLGEITRNGKTRMRRRGELSSKRFGIVKETVIQISQKK